MLQSQKHLGWEQLTRQSWALETKRRSNKQQGRHCADNQPRGAGRRMILGLEDVDSSSEHAGHGFASQNYHG